MRLLCNLHVKGKPAVLPDRAIHRQSHYFIYRPLSFFFYLYFISYEHSGEKIFSEFVIHFSAVLCMDLLPGLILCDKIDLKSKYLCTIIS